MSNDYKLLERAVTAEAAVSPFRILKYGAADNGVVHAAAASDALCAVSGPRAIASGGVDDACFSGIAPVEYGGVVTRGAPLTSDATARAVAATAGQKVIGFATESGVEGTIGSVFIAPGHAPPTPGVVTSITKAVTHEDLTESDGAQTILFDADLPANAFILGREIRVGEGFDNAGTTATVTAHLGVSGGDIDAIVDGVALGAVADLTGPDGVRSQGRYGAVRLALTVLSDVDVDTLTTGELVAEVIYVVPTA